MNKKIIYLYLLLTFLVNANNKSMYIDYPCDNFTKGYVKKWTLSFKDQNTIHSSNLITLVKDISNNKIIIQEIGIFSNKITKQKTKQGRLVEYIRQKDGLYLTVDTVSNLGTISPLNNIKLCGKMKRHYISKGIHKMSYFTLNYTSEINIEELANEKINVPIGIFNARVFKMVTITDYGMKYSYLNNKQIVYTYITEELGQIMAITKMIRYNPNTSNSLMSQPKEISVIVTSRLVSYETIKSTSNSAITKDSLNIQ